MNKQTDNNFQNNMENGAFYNLSQNDRQDLRMGLWEMFNGLTKSNSARGGSLGIARQRAIFQIESFLKTKNPNNPVVKYMRKLFMEYRPQFAKMIMTSKKSNIPAPRASVNGDPKWGANIVNPAMEKINGQIKKFEGAAKQIYHDELDNGRAKVIEMPPRAIPVAVKELTPFQITKIKEEFIKKIMLNQYQKVA